LNAFWNFGDMVTSTTFSTSHGYSKDTTYIVSLKIISDKGCSDSTTDTMVVWPKPTAKFAISDTGMCLYHNKFMFSDSSKAPMNDTLITFIWNYGDKTKFDTMINSNHSYTADDTFYVKHYVVTLKGCVDSATKSLMIFPQPKLAFVVNDTSQCFASNNFIFNNHSTIKNPDTMAFKWYLGDGDTSMSNTPKPHTYKAVKSYSIKLTAKSNLGCTDTLIQKVRVKPQPVVNIGKDTAVNNTINTTLNAGTGYDSILWYNNKVTPSIQFVYTTTLKKDTIFHVWVKVDKNGCFTTDTINITVHYVNSIDNKNFVFDVKVYPNPTKDNLNISMNGLMNDVIFELTDMNGKVVQTTKVAANQNHILQTMDLSGLAKGIYFLNIKDNANKQSVKIVKY
jgi:PKD repeat protein